MEWTTVETGDGAKLSVRLFKPPASGQEPEPEPGEDVVVVLVHPYTILGGVQGLLRGMAEGVHRRHLRHARRRPVHGAGVAHGLHRGWGRRRRLPMGRRQHQAAWHPPRRILGW